MARCVYNEIWTDSWGQCSSDGPGGYVSAGRPKHGCGSVWNLSERPTLSDRAKQPPDGAFRRAGWVTAVQSRSDAEARGAAVYVRTPGLRNPCLWKRWLTAHQIWAAEAELGTAPPRELKGDRKTNKDSQRTAKKAGTGLINSRTWGGGGSGGGFVWCKCALKWVLISLPPGSSSSVSPNSSSPPPHRPTYSHSQMFGLNFTRSRKCFTRSLIQPYL